MIKVDKKILNVGYWIAGIIFTSLGIAFSTKSNFGVSTLSSTPYIIHVWLRDKYPIFTQGTMEYIWQGIVLILTCIACRKFRLKYLLSFMTAFISGVVLDGWYLLLGGNIHYENIVTRIVAFALGLIFIALSVACFFRTTLPLKVFEMTIVEVSSTFGFDRIVYKRCFDAAMFVLSLTLAHFLNHSFDGIGIGTLLVTIFNGPLIGFFGKYLDKIFSS